MDEMRQEDIERLRQTMPIPKAGMGRFVGRRTWVAVIAVAMVGVFFMPPAASALSIGGTVAFIFAMAAYYLASFVGQMLLILVGALIYIAQYNGFVTSAPVANGWVIVRDIANMFFIVALLLIAFGTMLGLSGNDYNYKTALPRFVMMAILVNFSRTICGLIIDFSQVVMLTFVNGFKEAAGGNFVDAFQITQLMQMDQPGEQPDFQWSVTLSMILALAFVCVASVVIIIMIAVLVVRIVYLWLLIVLSPLAFLSSAIPVGKAKGFYSDWWDKFNNQVLVGPFLAFFLWLALISVASGGIAEDGFNTAEEGTGETDEIMTQPGFRNIGTDGIQQFIIAIGLMLGGVAMAQQMSGAAVSAGKGIAKGAGKMAWRGTKLGARLGYQGARKMPVGWVKDKETGKRTAVNLASVTSAVGTRLGRSNLGRSLSKEGREAKQSQREISVLRAMGMGDAAKIKQMELNKTKAKSLAQKFSPEELRTIAKDTRASESDKQGALYALAEKGDSSLWGGGTKITQMVKDAGGSDDYEKEIRLMMRKHGDQNALIRDEDDLKSTFSALHSREKAKQMTGVLDGVKLDESGNMKNELMVSRMMLLEQKDMKEFSDSLKGQIQDAMRLAAQIDPSLENEIADKWNELFSGVEEVDGASVMTNAWEVDSEEGKELFNNMEAELAGKRAAGLKKDKVKEEPADRAVAQQMSGGDDTTKNLASSAADTIKNVGAQLKNKDIDISRESGRKLAEQLAEELAGALGGLKDASDLSEVKVRDGLGREKKGAEAFGQTRLHKDLSSAVDAIKAGNVGNARKFVDSASVSAVSIANAGKMSPERRKEHYMAASVGDRKLTQAQGSVERLTAAATDKDRRREAKRLAAQAKSAASYTVGPVMGETGGKSGVLAPRTQEQMKTLREYANKVKGMKKFDEANMKVVKEMQELMTTIQRQLT